ncbi:hypothetical protein, partial [Klebsiella pneumoniae]|uniref:hypothetical protein n=1 Tax=Klebsiella pneumoniae TaxID=573 RepID=UPI00272F1020
KKYKINGDHNRQRHIHQRHKITPDCTVKKKKKPESLIKKKKTLTKKKTISKSYKSINIYQITNKNNAQPPL